MWHSKLLELVRKAESREASDRNRFLDLRSDMLRTLEEQVCMYLCMCGCAYLWFPADASRFTQKRVFWT